MIARELITALGFNVDRGGFQAGERAYQQLVGGADRADRATRRARRSTRESGHESRRMGRRARDAAGGMDRLARSTRRAGERARDADGRFNRTGSTILGVKQKSLSLDGALKGLGGLLAGGMVARGLGGIAEAASDANETLNLLEKTFSDETGGVLKWADRQAEAMGRSKYMLREYAGAFGTFLKDAVGDGPELADMSAQITQRVIDFASLKNLEEDDARDKFRAALAGEAEPMRSQGVDMTVGALQEYAKEQGKAYDALDKRGKMELRFQMLMAKTADAQGDAAATADGYANAMRGLRSAWTDFTTDAGLVILPKIERLITGARDSLRAFNEWTKGTNLVTSALYVIGTIGAASAAKAVAPFMKVAGRFAWIGAVIGGVILVVDDLITMFQGGESAIGSFIDDSFGLGTTDEIVRTLTESVDLFGEAWEFAKEDLGAFVDSMGPYLDKAWNLISKWATKIKAALPDWAQKGLDAIGWDENTTQHLRRNRQKGGVARAGMDPSNPDNQLAVLPGRANVQNLSVGEVREMQRKRGNAIADKYRARGLDPESLLSAEAQVAARKQGGQGAPGSVTFNGPKIDTVNVGSREDIAKLKHELARMSDEERRKTEAQLRRYVGGKR